MTDCKARVLVDRLQIARCKEKGLQVILAFVNVEERGLMAVRNWFCQGLGLYRLVCKLPREWDENNGGQVLTVSRL